MSESFDETVKSLGMMVEAHLDQHFKPEDDVAFLLVAVKKKDQSRNDMCVAGNMELEATVNVLADLVETYTDDLERGGVISRICPMGRA